MYDPSMDGSGMASGPSCFTIEFFDGSFLKEGQTVFVSYDGGGGLVDSNENSINSFSQIVNNSSTVYNDETAPTLMAAPMPSLNADGQTISLQFSESIDQSSVYNALQNFKLFVDGVEQTGSFSLESDASGGMTDASMYDPAMDGSGMTDGSGNSSSSSFTLRFNGTTIESGQSVLLSYANTNTDYTDSGITDLAGNDLASFAFQLDNMSGQDFTNPELTDGFVDDNGSSITVNVSEFIGFDLNQNDASGYAYPAGDASGMGFDASGADGSNFDWNSEAIKDAFTLNVNGRDLNSADFSLSYDSAMQNIVVSLEPSAQIFEGQTVTLDFDSTKITAEGAPQITDSNGNPLQPNTIVIDNDSSVVDTNPSYSRKSNRNSLLQQEITDKTNSLNQVFNLSSTHCKMNTLMQSLLVSSYNSSTRAAAARASNAQTNLINAQADLNTAQSDIEIA